MELLLQQKAKGGWEILVACILLNQTGGDTAHAVFPRLLREYPDPDSMAMANPLRVADVIRCCGLQNRKARILVEMSKLWKSVMERGLAITDPTGFPGVGKYAMDSWRIFVDGDYSVEPEDRALRAFLDDRMKGGDRR